MMHMADIENTNTTIVNKKYNGWRIDKFLSLAFPDFSRSQMQRLLKEGMVSRNGEIINDISAKVRENEEYFFVVPEPEDALPEPENIPLDIVYEDEDLLVVNKPAGMTVHPAPGSYKGTLVNALLFHCRDCLSGIGGVKRPGIVHRIDKDTSGLLVVAKNDNAHKELSKQFAEHSIERTYYAVVFGVLTPLSGRIESLIGRSPYDRKKMAVVKKNGKNAITNYQTQAVYKNIISLVKCNLETGRTHQIRVHLSSKGAPLVGDPLYGHAKKITSKSVDAEVRDFINAFPRQALHAKSLGFVHPKKKIFMQFDSDFPSDFKELIKNAEKI